MSAPRIRCFVPSVVSTLLAPMSVCVLLDMCCETTNACAEVRGHSGFPVCKLSLFTAWVKWGFFFKVFSCSFSYWSSFSLPQQTRTSVQRVWMTVTLRVWPVRTWSVPSCVSALLACSADQMEKDVWVSKNISKRERFSSVITHYIWLVVDFSSSSFSPHSLILCSVYWQTWTSAVPSLASVRTAAV